MSFLLNALVLKASRLAAGGGICGDCTRIISCRGLGPLGLGSSRINGAACLRALRLHSLRERVSGTICTEHHSHPRSCPPQAYRSQMHYKREPKIVPGSTLFQVRVNYPKDWNSLAQWVTTYYNITRRTVLPLIQVPELHMQASFSGMFRPTPNNLAAETFRSQLWRLDSLLELPHRVAAIHGHLMPEVNAARF